MTVACHRNDGCLSSRGPEGAAAIPEGMAYGSFFVIASRATARRGDPVGHGARLAIRWLRHYLTTTKELPFLGQIRPGRIGGVHQRDLPTPGPGLQLLLSGNSLFDPVKSLKIDQFMYLVAMCKGVCPAFTMLNQPSPQVVGHANIEHSVALVGKDIQVVLPGCVGHGNILAQELSSRGGPLGPTQRSRGVWGEGRAVWQPAGLLRFARNDKGAALRNDRRAVLLAMTVVCHREAL